MAPRRTLAASVDIRQQDPNAFAMNKIPMTAEGFNRLREELKRLKSVDRPAIIRAIAEARDHGDLAENAEYHAARDRQSFIEGRVIELEDKVARAEVIDDFFSHASKRGVLASQRGDEAGRRIEDTEFA